jgi:hypothetical protein
MDANPNAGTALMRIDNGDEAPRKVEKAICPECGKPLLPGEEVRRTEEGFSHKACVEDPAPKDGDDSEGVHYSIEGQMPFGAIRLEIIAANDMAASLVLVATVEKFLNDMKAKHANPRKKNDPAKLPKADPDCTPIPGNEHAGTC